MTSLYATVMSSQYGSNWNDRIIKKNLRSEMKGVQKKESIMGVRDSLVMPDSDPRDGFFYLPLPLMKDSYNLSRSVTTLLQSFRHLLERRFLPGVLF